jgi:outer membrane lipoprotein carrier protein
VKLALYGTILFALSDFAAPSNARAQEARQLVDRFERAYRSSHTLQAAFLERYFENGKEVRSEAGTAYFGRPGKMRWEYQSPEPNLFVVDGKWSWFYVPSDHTVTRVRAKESSDWRTPLALLAGQIRVSRLCSSVALDTSSRPIDSQHAVLSCTLREGDQANQAQAAGAAQSTAREKVLFEVNSTTGELSRILVSDPGGVQIEFRFADWKFDPPLDAAKFRFAPPKGVAIVDGDLAAPEGSSSLRVN